MTLAPRADVALVLQRQVVKILSGALRAADGFTVVPVFDAVPEQQSYPFVAIGDDQVVPDAAEGFEDSVEITSTIHVYSKAVGRPENKTIVGQIRRLIKAAAVDLGPDWTLVDLVAGGSHVVEDDDELTTHGIVTFKTLADLA